MPSNWHIAHSSDSVSYTHLIIALPDEKVEEICAQVSAEGEVCVAANYNCPGQIVISGYCKPPCKGGFSHAQAAEPYREFPAKATGNNRFDAYPNITDWYETIKLNYGYRQT